MNAIEDVVEDDRGSFFTACARGDDVRLMQISRGISNKIGGAADLINQALYPRVPWREDQITVFKVYN